MILIIIAGIILLIFILLVISAVFSHPVYCTDALTEAQNQVLAQSELLARISKMENNIEYFTDQAKGADLLFKEALMDNLPNEFKQERLLAKKECETNLNIEKKILNILKKRLESGNFNTSLSTSSSLGKRSLDQ